MEILKTNSSDLSVAIVIAIFYIILAIDEDVTSFNYLKKFNVLCYFLYGILKGVFSLSSLEISLIFLVIVVLASLNLTEKISDLEKNLSKKDLIIFSIIKWTVHTKFYIFILFAILSSLLFNFTNNLRFLSFFLVLAMLYHQISLSQDFFSYHDFDHLRKKLTELDTFKSMNKEKLDQIENILAFIIFMEDKDFFTRKKLSFSLTTVFNRKKRNFLNKKIKEKIKSFRPQTINPFKLYKKYRRGYSTIEMQVIQKIVLKEDSYQYTLRRKIFIEYLYSKYFYKALSTQLIRYKRTQYRSHPDQTKNKIHISIKILLLQYYFKHILNSPESIDGFINNAESRVSKDTYKRMFDEYSSNYLNIYYSSILEENISVFTDFNIFDTDIEK